MKKLFFLLMLCMSVATFAASSNKENVYLKNGSVIKGEIIEEVPNESIKIKTSDGCIWNFKMSEIVRITRSEQSTPSRCESTNLKKSWKFFMETGYTFGNKSGGRVELTPSFGYQLNPSLMLGAGAGLNYYTNADETFIPVYADFRGYIPTDCCIKPYIDLKPGYGFDLNGDSGSGFYFNFTAGIEIGKISMGIGYATQTLNMNENLSIHSIPISYDASTNTGGLTLKVAYAF